MYIPKVNSYCAGAGGMDWGLLEGGCEIQQSVEIEPIFSETLRMNFSHNVVCNDMTKMVVQDQPDSDVMVATYPCKKYSEIADLHGTRTGDELFLHYFRHMAIKQPEAYVVENVPGMKKFPVVMEAMTKLPGYYTHVFCPIDTLNWLPQKRKRLIIIGTKKAFDIAPPSGTRRIKLKDILEENPQVHIPDCVYTRMKGGYRDRPIISDPSKDDVAPTCVAHYAKDKGTRLVVDKRFPMGVRPYTVREFARLQGFPDSFQFAGTEAQQFVQIGNAVGIPVGRWIGKTLVKYFNS